MNAMPTASEAPRLSKWALGSKATARELVHAAMTATRKTASSDAKALKRMLNKSIDFCAMSRVALIKDQSPCANAVMVWPAGQVTWAIYGAVRIDQIGVRTF